MGCLMDGFKTKIYNLALLAQPPLNPPPFGTSAIIKCILSKILNDLFRLKYKKTKDINLRLYMSYS